MMPRTSSASNRFLRRVPRWRWIGLIFGSIALHLLALQWADGNLGLPAFPADDVAVVQARLHAPTPPVPPAPKPRAPRVAPKPQAAMAPVAQAAPAIAAPSPAETASPSDAVGNFTNPFVAAAADVARQQAASDSAAAASATADAAPRMAPPPSAALSYEVQALKGSTNFYGSGRIDWRNQAERYSINGKAEFIFFTVLTFSSAGTLDEAGLTPLLYTEKSRNKSALNTHFHRERNTISFSASTRTYPRAGGEQDRISIIWQLASMGRADPAQFTPGTSIDTFVAGVRDGEVWQIQVLGEEQITLANGPTKAWHLVRVPRPSSYDKTLDIWLAPELGWYPARLRYTEPNGDYLELSLSSINTEVMD